MITPRFSCTQTADCVIVDMYCPSIRASDVDIHVDENLLIVHINPYYLRLYFSHCLIEDDESSAKYDAGSGHLIATLTKEVKGEEFKDLDLLSKLLAPRPTAPVTSQPSIEVLGSEETPQDDQADLVRATMALSLERQEIIEAAEGDWQVPQAVPEPLPSLNAAMKRQYGFLNNHSGYFIHVSHTENEVNELGSDAETCPSLEGRQLRLTREDEKWDDEYYMADYADDSYIQELLAWQHPHITNQGDWRYSEDETLMMLRLPRKEYLADSVQTCHIYLTLLTLLFSYAYDSRTTQHDPTPESAWTICILTAAFSALDPPPYSPSTRHLSDLTHSELSATLLPSYRRSLAFPLYRSFALAEACRLDVAELLLKGKRTVVRCLLEMKHILDHHEVYYVYSKIWVDDFCVWAQASASDDVLHLLGSKLKSMRMEKRDIGWDLERLEAVVRAAETMDRTSDSDDESAQ